MTEETSPLSFPPLVDGGAGKPYAPLGAPRPPRSPVMSIDYPPTLACDSPSLTPGHGAGNSSSPFEAPRTPRTPLSNCSFGHASVSTHALVLGSPPAPSLQSDARPPAATFTRGPCSNQEVICNQPLATPATTRSLVLARLTPTARPTLIASSPTMPPPSRLPRGMPTAY